MNVLARVRAHSRWEEAGQPFFEGEVEPYINEMAVALGAYFGEDVGYGQATGSTPEAAAARQRREEYLLERGLLRRKGTGALIAPAWLKVSYPGRWHYVVAWAERP